MGNVDLLEFAAVAFVMCGLAVVIWEVVVKSPHDVIEMLTDVRGFAERPVPPSTERAVEEHRNEVTVPRNEVAERRMVA